MWILLKSTSADYEGPLSILQSLYESIVRDHTLSQSPYDLNTRRDEIDGPSKEDLIGLQEAE